MFSFHKQFGLINIKYSDLWSAWEDGAVKWAGRVSDIINIYTISLYNVRTYERIPYLQLGHVDEARVAILDRDDKLLAIRAGSTTYGTSVRRSKRRFCVIN